MRWFFIKAYYIKEDDKPNIFKQCIHYIKIQDNYLIIQPIHKKTNNKNLYKLAKKIKKICIKKNVKNVIISKKLQERKEFLDYIYAFNLNTFDGKWLLSYMAYETVDYILLKTNKRKSETEVSFLVNNISNDILENIRLFINDFKRVNIVTSHINEFKYFEKKIYDQYGMAITVTNNKRKSLEKAHLIINCDFSNELINQYNIYDKAVIINVQGNIKIKKKRFNGLTINNYEITSIHENDYFDLQKLNCFYLRDLLEAKLYRKDSFSNIRKDITGDFYKIKELYRK